MSNEIADLRQDYRAGTLVRKDLHADPFAQFRAWFELAREHAREPNAMTLATVASDARPEARVVLLKELDDQGFVFFTNYDSQKGQALAANPHAALCFWWEALERQVRVQGRVEKIPGQASDSYFHSRPRTSQLGAWASHQSQSLTHDDQLAEQFEQVAARYPEEVPRPEHWGGYRVVPTEIEFWQGRTSRLHDRFLYQRTPSGWTIDRLSP